MQVNSTDGSGKFRFVGAGPDSFSIQEKANIAIITPKNFGIMLVKASYKEKLFNEVFELIEKGKVVTVNFGEPSSTTNFFALELDSPDTIEHFDNEYGIVVEINKDTEDNLASSVTFKKIGNSQDYMPIVTDDSSSSFNSGDTDGGLLDADEKKGGSQGFFQTEWDLSEENSYGKSNKTEAGLSFFEENYLNSNTTTNFRKENIINFSGNFNLHWNLNSLFSQVVQYKKVANISRDNSSQQYDPKGLFVYLNKKINEIQIIPNGNENMENERLRDNVIAPIVVHFLQNNYEVSLNYELEDPRVLNYEFQRSKLFKSIDSKCNELKTGLNISSRVEEREDVGNTFTFMVLKVE